jgi:hypothetical protein
MEAGRAVVTDSTTAEGAYVALTRGCSDTRLYVLESPARIDRQQAADEAEFPVLLNEPEVLKAVAARLNQRKQAETATGIDREAGRIHQLSLQPIGELLHQSREPFRAERETADKAIGMALDRASLHAGLSTTTAQPRTNRTEPQNLDASSFDPGAIRSRIRNLGPTTHATSNQRRILEHPSPNRSGSLDRQSHVP